MVGTGMEIDNRRRMLMMMMRETEAAITVQVWSKYRRTTYLGAKRKIM